MVIYKLTANGSFGPDEIEAMSAAYEHALLEINLIDRDDALTEMVAATIVAVTAQGERDPEKIMQRALRALRVQSRKTGKNTDAHPAGF